VGYAHERPAVPGVIKRLPPLDRGMVSKVDLIKRNERLFKDVQNAAGGAFKRKALRLDIEQHFLDLEKGKENK
jgi:hypothetical protein